MRKKSYFAAILLAITLTGCSGQTAQPTQEVMPQNVPSDITAAQTAAETETEAMTEAVTEAAVSASAGTEAAAPAVSGAFGQAVPCESGRGSVRCGRGSSGGRRADR